MDRISWIITYLLLMCHRGNGLQCWVPGSCTGTFIFLTDEPSKERCLDACNANAESVWFTFKMDEKVCYLFQDCAELDESCTNCVSGHKDCPYEGDTKLLVVGGSEAYIDAEIVDLSMFPSTVCSKPANLTQPLFGSVGYLRNDQYPTVCGGRYEQDYFEVCLTLDGNLNQWTPAVTDLTVKRWLPAAVTLPDGRFWVTGGYDGNDKLDSSDLFDPSGIVLPGPFLPEPVYYHCMANLDSTRTVLTGGNTQSEFTSNRTWLYDWDSGSWTRLPDMNVARVAHQCGVLADGRLVVASGDGLGDQKLSTEILDPVSLTWSTSPDWDLPYNVMRAISIEYQGKLLLVTGVSIDGDSTENLISILEFDGQFWNVRNQTLQAPREWATGMIIKEGTLSICQDTQQL